MSAPPLENVTGIIDRIAYRNPDSGWGVLKVRIAGRRHLMTIVGPCLSLIPGEVIEATGAWTVHPEHGERFVSQSARATLPDTAAAAEKYLASGTIHGVGPELARRLVARFGAHTLDVIANHPERLREVSGLGPTRAGRLTAAWREQRALTDLIDFLNQNGLDASLAAKILKQWGVDAPAIVRAQPYRLMNVASALSFACIDRLALHLGCDRDHPERRAAALHEGLRRALARGHCALPTRRVLRDASRLLAVAPESLQLALEEELSSGRLVAGDVDDEAEPGIFIAKLAAAEDRVAAQLVRLAEGRPPWRMHEINARLPAHSRRLSRDQQRALQKIVRSKLSLLTGGAGAGKTTLIRSLRALFLWGETRVICCAPTGRAAQRMAESTDSEAHTIHRLLGCDSDGGGFRFGPGRPLAVDLLIIDEMSMVGVELLADLLDALPAHAAVIMVGDAQQLPSVQAGRVLDSILKTRAFNHVHLHEVFRQADGRESGIVRASLDVIQGRPPSLLSREPGQDFHMIEVPDAAAATAMILELVKTRLPARYGFDPIHDVQVICAMNKGDVGAHALNRRLQKILNPQSERRVDTNGWSFVVGDKVIVQENDYEKEIFNGDVGLIETIDHARRIVEVSLTAPILAERRRVEFAFSELEKLALAFALSVHKAQGSEYPVVILPILPEAAPLLERRLFYTAITRGRNLVVVVGNTAGLKLALRAHPGARDADAAARYTGLTRRILAVKRTYDQFVDGALGAKPGVCIAAGALASDFGAGAAAGDSEPGGAMNAGVETKVKNFLPS